MSKREAITRYSLIIKKVEKQPCTFEGINDYLNRQSELRDYDFTVSKRTFQRDLDEIRSIFNIDIQFDFSRRVYFIADGDEALVQHRLLEAFDTFNALNVTDGISKYIQFEQRRQLGTEHLYGLLYAIKSNLLTRFDYYKFWDQSSTQRVVEPYFLKEAQNRWYVVAKDTNDNRIKTFGLDRVSELEVTKRKFTRLTDIDLDVMFQDCIGVINPDDESPQKVILSFTRLQGQYIKSYPFHRSQKVVEDGENTVVELYVKITHDLLMELLSYGEEVQVVAPRSLAEELIAIHVAAAKSLKKRLI